MSRAPVSRESRSGTPDSAMICIDRAKSAVPDRRRMRPTTGIFRRSTSSSSRPASLRRTAIHAATAPPMQARTINPFAFTQSEKSMSACVTGGSAAPLACRNSPIFGITATTR